MKTISFLLTPILIMFFSSCKKDKQDPLINQSECIDCKLTEITMTASYFDGCCDEIDTVLLSYNENGKLSHINYDNLAEVNYSYAGDSCIELYNYNEIEGSYSHTIVHKLNNNQEIAYSYKQSDTSWHLQYQYYPDSIVLNASWLNDDCQTLESKHYTYFFNSNYTNVNRIDISGGSDMIYSCFNSAEYYDKENKFPIPLMEFYMEDFEDFIHYSMFMPKNSNLIKNWQYSGRTYTYEYEFNSADYVTFLKLTQINQPPDKDIIFYFNFKYE